MAWRLPLPHPLLPRLCRSIAPRTPSPATRRSSISPWPTPARKAPLASWGLWDYRVGKARRVRQALKGSRVRKASKGHRELLTPRRSPGFGYRRRVGPASAWLPPPRGSTCAATAPAIGTSAPFNPAMFSAATALLLSTSPQPTLRVRHAARAPFRLLTYSNSPPLQRLQGGRSHQIIIIFTLGSQGRLWVNSR